MKTSTEIIRELHISFIEYIIVGSSHRIYLKTHKLMKVLPSIPNRRLFKDRPFMPP